MKISADLSRCEGHGLCQMAAPTVYELDDEAMVTLLHDEVPPELEQPAETGAQVCPVGALRLLR